MNREGNCRWHSPFPLPKLGLRASPQTLTEIPSVLRSKIPILALDLSSLFKVCLYVPCD